MEDALLQALSRLQTTVAVALGLSIVVGVAHSLIAWSMAGRVRRVEQAVERMNGLQCGEHRVRLDEHSRWLDGHEERIQRLERA